MNDKGTLTIRTDNTSTKIQSFDPYLLVGENHPILHKSMPEFDFTKYDLKQREELATRLRVTMKKFGGLGLAAPQCGFETRVFIIGHEHTIIECFNPKVNAVSSETIRQKEGCLTFPALYVTIERPISAQVEYQDVHGEVHRHTFHGVTARCFLHEMDHLNGRTFTDLVGPAAMMMARKKQEKLIKRYLRNQKNQAKAK